MKNPLAILATVGVLALAAAPAFAAGVDVGIGGNIGGAVTGNGGNAGGSGGATVNIDPGHPLGDLDVDVSHAIDAKILASLSGSKVARLNERCRVVVNSPDAYQADAVAWCRGYMKLQQAD